MRKAKGAWRGERVKDALTFEVGYEGHGQALPGDLMSEGGGEGAQGHRDVLLHLDLLDGASRAEGAKVEVLARAGAGHQVAEAGVADPLLRVLLQLLGRHQGQAEPVLGHQQLPGEVAELHRQLEDVPGHLEGVGLPEAVPVVHAAWKRGARGTQAGRRRGRASSQLSRHPEAYWLFPLVFPSPLSSPLPTTTTSF